MPDCARYEAGFWYTVHASDQGAREGPIWTVKTSGSDDPEWAAWTLMSTRMVRSVDETRIPKSGALYIEGVIHEQPQEEGGEAS